MNPSTGQGNTRGAPAPPGVPAPKDPVPMPPIADAEELVGDINRPEDEPNTEAAEDAGPEPEAPISMAPTEETLNAEELGEGMTAEEAWGAEPDGGFEVDAMDAVEGAILNTVAKQVAISVNERAYELLDPNNKEAVAWAQVLAPVRNQKNVTMLMV